VPLDELAHLLGHQVHALVIELGTQERELLSAVPREEILLANALLDRPRHLLEHRITGEAPEGVVDLLEVIDVDERERQRALVPAARSATLPLIVSSSTKVPLVEPRASSVQRPSFTVKRTCWRLTES
jgi:hypothetical protein